MANDNTNYCFFHGSLVAKQHRPPLCLDSSATASIADVFMPKATEQQKHYTDIALIHFNRIVKHQSTKD